MIQKGNFLLLEISEFREWLKKQSITRNIDRLQVHHTASPNYTTRQMIGGIAKQDVWKCLEGMRTYHLSQGWAGTGQNITVLEDGRIAISLDRDLNKTPAGIEGSNTGAICVEIVGNFDKGGDQMTSSQKESVIHLYACLTEKLNLSINTDTIVYHAWYAPKTGTRLSDFIPGKSSKTCPGTAFWGDGNTIAAANKNFIPQIKAELERLRNGSIDIISTPIVKERVYLANNNIVRCDGDYTKTATDVRHIKFKSDEIELKFVYEKGAKVSDLVKKHKANIGFNAPFFYSGNVLGNAISDSKVISEASGKMLKWHSLGVKNEKVEIGMLDKSKGYTALFQGAPLLVENGVIAYEKYRISQEVNDDIGLSRCQRTFIGIDKNNDVFVFIGDGRTKSDQGLTLQEAALYAKSKGCVQVLNLDGGGSTVLADQNGGLNQKMNTGANERVVNHAVLVFIKPKKEELGMSGTIKATTVKVDLITNGKKEIVDGLIANGLSYIPLRKAGEYFEATVGYDTKTKTPSLTK